MKIYTKTGDKGQTGLVDGSRVSKADVRIRAVGALDEANAFLGWMAAELSDLEEKRIIFTVQSLLFNCGARIAEPTEKSSLRSRLPNYHDIQLLEKSIDTMTQKLEPLTQFILPGGQEIACRAHITRCIVRRAEREMITLRDSGVTIEAEILQFINRLSDWLFTFARYVNHKEKQGDIIWQPSE